MQKKAGLRCIRYMELPCFFVFRSHFADIYSVLLVEAIMVRRSMCLAILLTVLLVLPANAGWIGITVQNYASEEGTVRGIKVVKTGQDSPSARAGLEAGDVILSANGIPVGSVQDFVKTVREVPVGKPIEMRVLRGGTILSLAPIVSEPPRSIADYERGLENFHKGLYEQAITDFTKALGVDPSMADSHFYRARAYEKKEKYDQAIADYTKVIQLNPRALTSYINRGYAYEKMRHYDKAINDFTKAIEMEPKMAPLYVDRARVYFLKGLYDQAIADCSRAIELLPKIDIAYHMRADSYNAKGMKREAMADYEQAAAAYIEKGIEIAKSGKYDDAIRRFESAIKLNTKHSSSAYYHRGVAFEKKGDHLKAINDYSEAIRLNPQFAEAYLRRGYVFAQKLKDYENAKKDWEKALQLDPQSKTGEVAKQNLQRMKGAK